MSTERGLRWLVVAGLCLAVAGCGSPGAADGPADPGDPGSDVESDQGGGGGDGGEAPASDSEGPITVAVDGQTFGYSIGRCDIIDGVVYAQARSSGDRTQFHSVQAVLPEWDREIAHSRRDGRISAVVGDANTVAELTAGRNDAGTSWDWTVSGDRVEITAVMGNRSTASRDQGVERFADLHTVTITMDCSGPFGSIDPNEPMHEEPLALTAPTDRVPGAVTVDVDGTAYEITYLSTCQFFSNDLTAEGVADEAYVYLYSEGRGVHLDFRIGDLREEELLEYWMLPPDASLQSDFPFEGSGTARSWSGTIVREDGTQAEAAITVECTEGDQFEQAGAASITVDGTTHVLDEVSACTIDGTTIDFFGRQAVGDVAVIVTSGGSDVLFGDASGQTVTRGVEFTVTGQRATWSGTLSGDREASIDIDCS